MLLPIALSSDMLWQRGLVHVDLRVVGATIKVCKHRHHVHMRTGCWWQLIGRALSLTDVFTVALTEEGLFSTVIHNNQRPVTD